MSSKERKELTKQIESLVSKQDAFTKAVQGLENFKKECITDLDTDIELKKKELEELAKKYENDVIDGKTRTDQTLKKYEYEEAVKILEKHGEVPSFKEDIENYKNTIVQLKIEHEAGIKKVIDEEKKNSDSALKAVINNSTLKNAADNAELKARANQLENQVVMLNGTITNLQNELKCQRELTKDVAMAGKQGAIQQTFGKN